MTIFPIIPIWIMIIICLILLFYIIKNNNKSITQIIIVCLIFVINLRIMIPTEGAQVIANNLDVLFVIDSTLSMNALDYNSDNRLYAVKKDCNYIIKRLNGARFSVITFNNDARIVTPYTKDANMTIEAIDIINPIDELYARGTSLNVPLDIITSSLKSSQKKDNKIRIIFFISDGEITTDERLKSYHEISKYIDNGAVLGYGTTNGGYIKVTDKYTGKEEYIMDYTDYNYGKAISRIDENSLKQIANDINIDYIHMEKQSKINDKLNEIERMARNGIETSDKSSYDEIYYIFMIPLFILLLIEFNKIRRKTI